MNLQMAPDGGGPRMRLWWDPKSSGAAGGGGRSACSSSRWHHIWVIISSESGFSVCSCVPVAASCAHRNAAAMKGLPISSYRG